MPYLIIIRGPLGIGKTTISKLLSEKLNADYFSIDEILKQNRLDVIDEEIDCIPEDNFLKVNQIIIQNISQSNKSIIIDGNFYYQNQLEDLIKNIHLKPFVFTLTAPLETCLKRDSQRSTSLGIDATTTVYNLVSKFKFGEIIDVSNLSIEESVQKIYSKVI